MPSGLNLPAQVSSNQKACLGLTAMRQTIPDNFLFIWNQVCHKRRQRSRQTNLNL